MTRDSAFYELPRDAFPFTVSLYPLHSVADENPLWTQQVDDLGVLVVPSAADLGQPTRLVIRYANGQVDRSP